MMKIYLSVCSLFLVFSAFSQTPFSSGNLVVYTVGNGTDTLISSGFPVTLNEYTTSGAFVAAHPLPTVISGANRRIVASGSASSEGQITRSVDTRYLLVTGYDTFPDPQAVGTKIVNSTSASVNRVVGIMNAAGVIDASTALSDAYSGNNIRGAVSTNGTDIWTAGTGSSSSSAGVRYTTKGATTSTQLSTSVTNIRTVNIFKGQLYSSSASGAFTGVCQDGTGEPTVSGQTITLLPGFGAGSPSTYAFSIKPSSDVIFATNDNSATNGGGIQKWIFNGSTWTLAYTLKAGLTAGTRGLTVDWSGPNPILYAITADNASNKLVKITDTNDSTTAFTILDSTLSKYYIYRGIAFVPVALVTPVTLLNFKADAISDGVEVLWTTSQEINSKQFVIERSANGSDFFAIKTTAAMGNSNTRKDYKFYDENPFAGNNYYRLKSVDIDGKFSYSDIILVKYSVKNFSVYPNPAANLVTLTYSKSINGKLYITDMLGRTVKVVAVPAGSGSMNVPLDNLVKGRYTLRYTNNNTSVTTILTKE